MMRKFGMILVAGITWIACGGYARSEDAVECRIGTMAPFRATRHHCDMLSVQADAMRDVLTNAPAGYPMIPIMDQCMRGLNANLPGHDYNTYFNTCSQILQSMRTVVR